MTEWTRDMVVGIFFLSQTVLGMLGNSALLCCFIIADFSGIRVKPTDLIVKHLAWANFLVLCRGIPETIAAFNQTYYLDYVSCKLVLYFHRVGRGVSLSSTSLLSVFQAITISPSNSRWTQFKPRVPRIIGPFLGLCWALQLLLYIFIFVYTTDIRGRRNVTGIQDFGYCTVINSRRLISTLIIILISSNDVFFWGLMMLASGYMVLFILLKHKQRVKHIHRSLSPKSSPETRATQSILTLVSSFVIFYATSVGFASYLSVSEGTRWLFNIDAAMAACFPAFCPFLLIRHYASLFRLCCTSFYQIIHCSSVVREI